MVLTWLNRGFIVNVMFERFTPRARRAVVAAQEEARALGHNYIGTEHVLLGLLTEPEGVAARALDGFGITLTGVRADVTAIVGAGDAAMKGHIPFTPRAKKILEIALREALEMHHNYIGTEHMLLGLLREKDGIGAQVLAKHADLLAIRMAVLDTVRSWPATPARRRWLRRRGGSPGEPDEVPTTPAADASMAEAARLAGSSPVGSHHLLLAALADPDTAAARTLVALGLDLDRAKQALGNADVTGTSDELPEERGRRHMRIRVTGSAVTIEATDDDILGLGRAAAEALGDADEPGTIRGDLPVSASLGAVWQELRASLEDIRRRASAAKGTEPTGETAQAGEGERRDLPGEPGESAPG
jgi:ATP-dependent Clp protease ATP-binding subunit ClpA